MLRINAARISTAMVLQPLLAGFLKAYPEVQVELTNDEGYVDIVERGFDAGVRLGESVQKDMVAVPLGGPVCRRRRWIAGLLQAIPGSTAPL